MDDISRGKLSQCNAETMGRIKSRPSPGGIDKRNEAAAGDHTEPGRVQPGNDRKENIMQEKKLEEMLGDLMANICDNNCKKIDSIPEEEAEEICAHCSAGEHICRILNENLRYSNIVLCEECQYRIDDDDCQGTTFSCCRNPEGLDGNVGPKEGCSRGKRYGKA